MSQLEISVTGRGTAIRPAERALLSVSAECPQVKTPAEASSLVTASANAIREIIMSLCPQDEETGRTLPDAPIVHYSLSTMDTTSHTPRSRNPESGKMEPDPTLYSARVDLKIKFQDFAVLNKVATQLSAMDHVRVSGVSWKLTDATLDAIEGDTRRSAGRDAIQKAWDYAEVFGGIEGGEMELKRRVKAKSVGEERYYTQSNSPRMHSDKRIRVRTVGVDQLHFEPEDVSLEVTCNAKFMVDL